MADNYPDYFGVYAEEMTSVHCSVLQSLAEILKLTISERTPKLNQMSIYEHCDSSYENNYIKYIIRVASLAYPESFTPRNPNLIIYVNRKFSEEINLSFLNEHLLPHLADEWNKYCDLEMGLLYKSDSFLPGSNDVIQTIHIFRSNEQIFKILYFYETWSLLISKSVG